MMQINCYLALKDCVITTGGLSSNEFTFTFNGDYSGYGATINCQSSDTCIDDDGNDETTAPKGQNHTKRLSASWKAFRAQKKKELKGYLSDESQSSFSNLIKDDYMKNVNCDFDS